MRASLRDPVDRLQRHPVTEFRDNSGVPKSSEIPRFDSLGARVAYWRKQRGWSRPELAKRARIPYSTLAGIEDGDQQSSTKVPEIAAALGLNPIYLASGRGDPESQGAPADDFWPFPFPREELLDLDPVELELAGLKFQRVIEEIRAKRSRLRSRKAS